MYLGLSNSNVGKITDSLQDVDWASVFKRATQNLQNYGDEYENNVNASNQASGSKYASVSGNNSDLGNSASVESVSNGSPDSGSIGNGSAGSIGNGRCWKCWKY